MQKLIQNLKQVNWDFSDYNSLKYPLDINSIPWYPAAFPPPIPKFLIALLSEEDNVVLDPFGGRGTTIIEAIKQNRRFYYNDLNPFAADTTKSMVEIIKGCCIDKKLVSVVRERDEEILLNRSARICESDYEGKNEYIIKGKCPKWLVDNIKELQLSEELTYWYHVDTLGELLDIYRLIKQDNKEETYYIRKFAFVAILKEVCSQRGHFTYITDNCKPSIIKYYNAISAYFSMLERVEYSMREFLKQFDVINGNGDLLKIIERSCINCGDSKELDWVENNSVDFVMTSPPYLCAQDYIKTMRLINLFFPNKEFQELSAQEIGARYRRQGRADEIVKKFYDDMNIVFGEIDRVLKNNKYFCLVLGQGKGKITQGYDTISDIRDIIVNNFNFVDIFETTRSISFKSVRIGGVDSEKILIFQKRK